MQTAVYIRQRQCESSPEKKKRNVFRTVSPGGINLSVLRGRWLSNVFLAHCLCLSLHFSFVPG
jgi:hypothetical protein